MFVEVGLEVEVAPTSFDTAGQAFERARRAAADFLHAVRGGPVRSRMAVRQRRARGPHRPALESVEGVDFVTSLLVTARGAVVGDALQLASEELPTPGSIRVRLTTGGGA